MAETASALQAEASHARLPAHPTLRGLERVEVLPPLAAFLGGAWFFAVGAGSGGLGSWLLGLAFSAFLAALTAAVGASLWFHQWRARGRLRNLHRLRDEGLLTDAEVERGRRAVLDGL